MSLHTMNPQNQIPVAEIESPTWQSDFLVHLLPRVKTHARFRFRDLPRCERDEAEAEAIAVALMFFVRLTERGKTPSTFATRIARFSVLRVKSGRVLGTGERSRDVLSRLARQRRGFQVESLDAGHSPQGGAWQAILVEDRQSTPAEIAAVRIDFCDWLDGMTCRRRQLAEMLAAGHSTAEAAEKFHLSPGRISQIRREFQDSWEAFQGELAEQPGIAGTAR